MNNVIKAKYYSFTKNTALKVIGGLMLLSIIVYLIVAFIPVDSYHVNSTAMMYNAISQIKFFSFLFALLCIAEVAKDYQQGLLKNIFSKGINKTKYYFGNLISILSIGLAFYLVDALASILISGCKYGFGVVSNPGMFTGFIITELLLYVSVITFAYMLTILCKKGVAPIFLIIIAYAIPAILALIGLKYHWDFDCLLLSPYVNFIAVASPLVTTKTILWASLTSVGYIAINILLSLVLLKRQDVK